MRLYTLIIFLTFSQLFFFCSPSSERKNNEEPTKSSTIDPDSSEGKETKPQSTNLNNNAVRGLVNVEDNLNIRKEPKGGAELVSKIPGRSLVYVIQEGRIDTIGNYIAPWYEVDYEGTIGWAYGGFIVLLGKKSWEVKSTNGNNYRMVEISPHDYGSLASKKTDREYKDHNLMDLRSEVKTFESSESMMGDEKVLSSTTYVGTFPKTGLHVYEYSGGGEELSYLLYDPNTYEEVAKTVAQWSVIPVETFDGKYITQFEDEGLVIINQMNGLKVMDRIFLRNSISDYKYANSGLYFLRSSGKPYVLIPPGISF